MLIGSLANRSASVGIAVFPNLGYKKDAFLEPSLVVNILFPLTRYSTIPTLNHTNICYLSSCLPNPNSNNPNNPLVLLALIPALLCLLLEGLIVLYLWWPQEGMTSAFRVLILVDCCHLAAD
jgi:hypothetical protein